MLFTNEQPKHFNKQRRIEAVGRYLYILFLKPNISHKEGSTIRSFYKCEKEIDIFNIKVQKK